MAKPKEKTKARRMRRRGESIKSIASELEVSKGSVSMWCQDIKLTAQQTDLLKQKSIEAGHKGRIIGAEMNRKKRLDKIDMYRKTGRKDIGRLSKRDLLLLGLGLYWGEGTKGRSSTAVVNSDPKVITLMIQWFTSVFRVSTDRFRPRIFINEIHIDRESKLLKFWSDTTGIPKHQFARTVFLKMKNKKLYENHDSYYGILSLRILKSSDLKYKVLGLLDAVG